MRSSIVILSLIALVASRPIRRQAACPSITEQDYADFQISDGTAGNAETAAKAVFVDPSDGCDLSTVDEASLEALKTMREAAEDAEVEDFNPAIEAAEGAEADALQAGKIANKVLKLTGAVQVLEIQLAQGEDVAEKLAEEQGKLAKNIATDEASAGEEMVGIA